jgi:hypothetical protein
MRLLHRLGIGTRHELSELVREVEPKMLLIVANTGELAEGIGQHEHGSGIHVDWWRWGTVLIGHVESLLANLRLVCEVRHRGGGGGGDDDDGGKGALNRKMRNQPQAPEHKSDETNGMRQVRDGMGRIRGMKYE